MKQITKITSFEMSHRLKEHSGCCRNLHGHSYKLEVTIMLLSEEQMRQGMILDFADLKAIIQRTVVEQFDHCCLLHKEDELVNLLSNAGIKLAIIDQDPTAENMLSIIRLLIEAELLPYKNLILSKLKLYETETSFAEWTI